jgi:hypothetical protein
MRREDWHPLQRYTGCRATYAETHLAIAALVSDRAARRTTGTAPTSCSPDKPPPDHPPANRQASLPDLNYSRGRKLAAQCRAEWMICMPLGHMAEPAA